MAASDTWYAADKAEFLVEILVKVTDAVVGGVLKLVTVIARVLDREITWPIITFRVDKKFCVVTVHEAAVRDPPLIPVVHVGAAEEKYVRVEVLSGSHLGKSI